MMRTLRAIFFRLTGYFLQQRHEREFDEELASHLQMHIDDGVRSGLSHDEARRQALLRLGGTEQVRQAHRESRGMPRLESYPRDLRDALRTLVRRPSVTLIAIVSIGLGVGANATIFSMVSRLLLRPAPFGDPSMLLSLHIAQRGENCCNSFSLPNYNDLREQATSFSGVSAYYDLIPASISGNGEPERTWGQGVTPNFFDVLQLPMVFGRGFASNEDHAPVVVLSARFWQRRLNSDPNIIGETVRLSGHPFTVIGIAPASFHSVDQILDMEFWVPLGLMPRLVPDPPSLDDRNYHWLDVFGRLKPGVSRHQVMAQLSALAQRVALNHPESDKGNSFVFEQAGSLPPRQRDAVLIFLSILSLVVLLLLAIAGANVANLLFVQAAARQREFAVHLALGASRGRLRRKLLMESMLLGMGGGLLGVILSVWATRALSALHLPAPVPLDVRIHEDWRTLAYAFALSVTAGLALGLAPAWAASRLAMANALKGGDALGRSGRRFTLRNALVVAQIAMSATSLLIAGLFLHSLQSATSIDIGFRPRGLVLLSVDPRLNGYTTAQTTRFLAQLRQQAAALPGADAAVCTDVALLSGGNRSDGFTVVGGSGNGNASATAELYMATSGFFDTLGIPRLAGRDFGSERAEGPKVAVVNQAFVDHLFGGSNPIGQRVTGGNATYEIIGVVGNAKARTLGEETRPILYRSFDQSIASDPSLRGYTLIVHTPGNPAALLAPLRRNVYALDPAMAIYDEETMDEHIRSAYFLPGLAATLFGVFGFMGVVLATTGLYGVMSYSIARRTHEIGIRMALGARSGAVELLFLRQGIVLTVTGIALGWPAAWMISRLVRSFLYSVQPHDALTFAAVPILLTAVALLACWIPARRASLVDPAETLRAE
jgi:predicted permease